MEEKDIVLGIRPEHISYVKQDNPNIKDSFEGEVVVLELMGSEFHVHTKIFGQNNVIIRVPILDLSEEEIDRMKFEKKINFKFNSQSLHLFDKDTQLNLLLNE